MLKLLMLVICLLTQTDNLIKINLTELRNIINLPNFSVKKKPSYVQT